MIVRDGWGFIWQGVLSSCERIGGYYIEDRLNHPMVVAMYMEARAIEWRYLHAAIYAIGRAVEFCLESDSFCVVLI
jgi:hypothetical protein